MARPYGPGGRCAPLTPAAGRPADPRAGPARGWYNPAATAWRE